MDHGAGLRARRLAVPAAATSGRAPLPAARCPAPSPRGRAPPGVHTQSVPTAACVGLHRRPGVAQPSPRGVADGSDSRAAKARLTCLSSGPVHGSLHAGRRCPTARRCRISYSRPREQCVALDVDEAAGRARAAIAAARDQDEPPLLRVAVPGFGTRTTRPRAPATLWHHRGPRLPARCRCSVPWSVSRLACQ